MGIRDPAVAGQFYPGLRQDCLNEIRQFLEQCPVTKPLPDNIVAGIVPHAGWVFSGSLAAMVFAAIKQVRQEIDTFIIFGAAHSYHGLAGAVYNSGGWLSPLGEAEIDEAIAEKILNTSDIAAADPESHRTEHSIEVQVPFIQHLFPGAKIVPILISPGDNAVHIGRDVASVIIATKEKKIVCIGSTDLTHYGPRYGFTPVGVGDEAVKWAKEVNDAEFIESALKMQPEKMLQTAAKNYNACGAGAAAAVVAAAAELGRTEGILLAHTTSEEVMRSKFSQSSEESVGYAAIIF